MGLSPTNVTTATWFQVLGRIVMLRHEARLLANGPCLTPTAALVRYTRFER